MAAGTFVPKGENVNLLGPPGIDKTHFAIRLGAKATHSGYPVLFDRPASGSPARQRPTTATGSRLSWEEIRRYKLIDRPMHLPKSSYRRLLSHPKPGSLGDEVADKSGVDQ